jgi:5-methylcytosine-specific restriction enzyme subunit McrC
MMQPITLILREGVSYRPDNLAECTVRLVSSAEEEYGATWTGWPKIIARILNLRLSTTRLPGIQSDEFSEDAASEEEAETEWADADDGKAALARPTLSGGFRLGHLVGSGTLAADEVNDLPAVILEILPKITAQNGDDGVQDAETDRLGLRRMWSYACDLNLREDERATSVDDSRLPLHEWLIHRFLKQVDTLLARGIRASYVEHEDNLTTVRGRLSVRDNLTQNVHAPHRFYCRFEEFSPNRPENRLIKSAINTVRYQTHVEESRRSAAHLLEWLHEIPESTDIGRDFSQWRSDRLMSHYQDIRPTCEWILRSLSATPVTGQKALFGRFVRMNDVFERYVTRWMQERVQRQEGYRVYGQGEGEQSTWDLCKGDGGHQMRPDIRVYRSSSSVKPDCVAILDAKWKPPRADGKLASREDFYQMYAYASHWLGASMEETEARLIGLVYPTTNEQDISKRFRYDNLADVEGRSLKFLLPRRVGDVWREGYLIDGATRGIAAYLTIAMDQV